MMDRAAIAAVLAAQGIGLDEATLEAVVRWHRSWAKEWAHVAALALDDEPAPLAAWPPAAPGERPSR